MIFYKYSYIVYLSLTVFVVLYLVLKENPKHKLINLTLLLWLSSYSSLRSQYAWTLFPFIGRFKRGDYLIGILVVSFMVLSTLSQKRKVIKPPVPTFQKHLYYYLIISIFLYYLHNYLGSINDVRAYSFSSIYIAALLLVYGGKRFVTNELLRSTVNVVIYIGITTSIVGIIQFFIDPQFIKLGPFNNAFPGYYRPSGVFRNPGDHGLMLIVAVYAVAYWLKDIKLKSILIFLFVFNIILTFGRGIWVAFLFTVFFHLFVYYRHKYSKIVFQTLVLSAFMFGLISIAFAGLKDSDVKGRVFEDTLTARMGYYSYVMSAIPDHLLIGFGDVVGNRSYFSGMVALGNDLNWAMGRTGGIHNLILEEIYIRGIISTIFFLLFFYHFFKFSTLESIKKKSYIYCLFNYYLMGFFVYEFTVSGFLLSGCGFLTMFFTLLTSGIHYNKLDVSEFKLDIVNEIETAKK